MYDYKSLTDQYLLINDSMCVKNVYNCRNVVPNDARGSCVSCYDNFYLVKDADPTLKKCAYKINGCRDTYISSTNTSINCSQCIDGNDR